MAPQETKLDAGLASLDHYKSRLPPWRYYIREKLLPVMRSETPYVALLQERMRCSALDSYFAMTANLGTHTCFMIALPILFWCGNAALGRAMANMLAAGVFFSGFVKDLLCLPRPLSPPLTRITMSGSAALEYGFPSTHSTNAVSVALYGILLLRDGPTNIDPTTSKYLQAAAYFYACSIILGRLYCGMHGFFDVVWGSILGATIAVVQYSAGPMYDQWLLSGTFQVVAISTLVVLVLVRIHPEPADNCPCFDDSVAFAGVVLGIQLGGWHFAKVPYALSEPCPGTAPFDLKKMGWTITATRIVIGVLVVFAWRAIMKPTLLKLLPPLFRVIEHLGLDLPRRFFKPASQYTNVPEQADDDNVIPSARDIPSLLRRRRAISIGPQSEADAYEALAYRELKRKDSRLGMSSQVESITETTEPKNYFQGASKTASHSRKRSLSLEEFRAQMGSTAAEALSPLPLASPEAASANGSAGVSSEKEQLQQEKDLFAGIQKPRVRYDVEVVTKLIVYSGIAWWAVEGNPILFHYMGLDRY